MFRIFYMGVLTAFCVLLIARNFIVEEKLASYYSVYGEVQSSDIADLLVLRNDEEDRFQQARSRRYFFKD